MKRFLPALFISLFAVALYSQAQLTDQPFARFPAISPDGSQVTFSWQGDIWTVPISGGHASRQSTGNCRQWVPQVSVVKLQSVN